MSLYCTLKRAKILPVFLFIFLITACSTIEFGLQSSGWDDDNIQARVSEYNLSYHYKIMGVPVQGDKSIVESFHYHPDGVTQFLFVSFPRVGILKTVDNGATIKSTFFTLSVLDDIFGYVEQGSEADKKQQPRQQYPDRCFIHFSVSPNDPDKVLFSAGPYIMVSSDRGETWKARSFFHDMDTNHVRDLFVTRDDTIIAFTQRRILTSGDWGKKWKSRPIRNNTIPRFKLDYLTGWYDASTDLLMISLHNLDDQQSVLALQTYRFFNKSETEINQAAGGSGVFISKDHGLTWGMTNIPVPLLFWENDGILFGGPLYPLHLYDAIRDSGDDKPLFPVDGKLVKLDKKTRQLVEYLLAAPVSALEVIPAEGTPALRFDHDLESWEHTMLIGLDAVYNAIKRFDQVDALHWQEEWHNDTKTDDPAFDYNLWRIFKRWTGMRTAAPVLYTRDKTASVYYRLRPNHDFLEHLVKYAVEGEIRLNTVNPFMKKIDDVEFIDPAIDPTNGFPVIIEYSDDNGKTWQQMVQSAYVRTIIDPLGTKRSGFYWYKNVEQRKFHKLQISFGFDKGISYVAYPHDLVYGQDELLIQMQYFSLYDSFKDLYRIKVE